MRTAEFSSLFNGRKSNLTEFVDTLIHNTNRFETEIDFYYREGNHMEFENVAEALKNY